MSLRVLCRDQPQRTIALSTEDHILSFQHIPTTTSESLPTTPSTASPRCIVEFSSRSSAALKDYRPLSTCYGTLGLITLNGDVFLCAITRASQVATVRPGETAQRINSVEFCEDISRTIISCLSNIHRLPEQLELRQRARLRARLCLGRP